MEIQTVEIWTEDIDRQAHYYQEVLGFSNVEHAARDRLEVQAGKTRLVLHPAEVAPSGHYHFAFDVPENQFQEAFQWLRERVTPSANAEGQAQFRFEKWNSDSVYFKDPDGNILELIARHNQPNASSVDFSSHSILSISEFGIPTQDVRQSVQRLCETLPATPYDGAGSDEFTAVGDELGLLIVVKEGRIWMPGTGKAAVFVPFYLEVRSEQGKAYAISAPEYPFELECR